MSDEQKMQVVTIGFAVPADLDLPSETKARMKMVIMESLRYAYDGGMADMYAGSDRALIKALLTES